MMRPVLLALPPIAPDSLVFDTGHGDTDFQRQLDHRDVVPRPEVPRRHDLDRCSGPVRTRPLTNPMGTVSRSWLTRALIRSSRPRIGSWPATRSVPPAPSSRRVCGYDRAVHLADAARRCAYAHHDDAHQRYQSVDLWPEGDLHGHGRPARLSPPARCSSASTAPTSEHQSRSTPLAWRRLPPPRCPIGSHARASDLQRVHLLRHESRNSDPGREPGALDNGPDQQPEPVVLWPERDLHGHGRSGRGHRHRRLQRSTASIGAPVALVAGTATYTTSSLGGWRPSCYRHLQRRHHLSDKQRDFDAVRQSVDRLHNRPHAVAPTRRSMGRA